MFKTIQEHEFTDTLIKDEYASFSYYGAKALFEYLELYEESTSQKIEFDFVAIRCQFSEIDNLKEFLKGYDNINTLEELRENTTVIDFRNPQYRDGNGKLFDGYTGYIVDTEF